MIEVSAAWQKMYPQAHLGTLTMDNVANPQRHAKLEHRKRLLEQELRERFEGLGKADLAALPVMRAYRAYYRRFRKTYHVLLQLRSVVVEGKPLPSVAALVEAMFMAEVKHGLLTAGHDLDLVQDPITLDIAKGTERYVLLNGRKQTLKADDMIMTDAQGVICSVIYGLDKRTAIRPITRRVMFVVYAPGGIETGAITTHLDEIRDNVLLISPAAVTTQLQVYSAQT